MAQPSLAQSQDEPQADPQATSELDLFESLRFRHLGPLGNRVTAVAGVPGQSNVYFAGAASGGLWRSVDGGHGWRPVFDDQNAPSIGAVAIAPSDKNVVWVGTGEAFIRSNVSIGDGVYLSTDGGDTWQHRGLVDSGRIARLVVHPDRPETVWAAALGHGYGEQEERGIFKTEDGGLNWRRVLHVDGATGASDVVIDPSNPRLLYAGLWQFVMDGSGRTSGGPGSGLWRSRDGGETWTRLEGGGLPASPWGRVGLATTAADPDRLYALIETSSNRDFAPVESYPGTLWRSSDGGDSWSMVNDSNALHQRPLYYSRVVAAPDDADEVHFMSVRHWHSTDGGVDVVSLGSGWDHHDLWIDPLDPSRLIVGHDGGVSISSDRGRSWYRPQLPIAQMYSVAVDDEIPYRVSGNRQDGPAVRGPSRTLAGGEIPLGAWRQVGGCEVGASVPDAQDSEIVYSTCYDGILERWHGRSGHSRDISVWPEAIESWPASELRYRFTWNYPIEVSPHVGSRLYAGSHVVHQSDDGGESWRVISPDLTSADPELMRRRGGLTLDDAGPTIAPSLSSLVESPVVPGELWAGTNDGRLHRRPDEASPWQDLSDRLPGLPALGTVSDIAISPHSEGLKVYVSIDRHRENDRRPWVYRSVDGGDSWRLITGGLDESVFSYVHSLAADPVRDGLLFLGTENGLYFSWDDGERWRRVGGGLPSAPVYDLEIQERFGDLVVATYGRGLWLLDDLSALRQLRPGSEGHVAKPRLVEPRPTYRFRSRTPRIAQPDVPAVGRNPPAGAAIDYFLPEDVAEVKLEIVDGEGQTVRSLEAKSSAGLHRVWWDLHHEATTEPRLRTPSREREGQALPADGWRPLRDGRVIRLLARPGSYTVRLRIELESQEAKELEAPLELLLDPASEAPGIEAAIARQYEALDHLEAMAERAAYVINESEWLRQELQARSERLAALQRHDGGEGLEAAREAIRALEAELADLEGLFFDLRLTGAGQDTLRWKRLLWSRIGNLASRIGSSDGAPTAAQLEVLALLESRLESAEQAFASLRSGGIRELAELLSSSGLAVLPIGERD